MYIHTTNLSRDDLLVDLDGLVSEERRIASSHFINENTKCPPVHCFIVTLRDGIQWNNVASIALDNKLSFICLVVHFSASLEA